MAKGNTEQAHRRQWRRVMMMIFFGVNVVMSVFLLTPVGNFFPWFVSGLLGAEYTLLLHGVVFTLFCSMNIVGVLFAKMGD